MRFLSSDTPMIARVAQLTDPHIVSRGSTYFGIDTAKYLEAAIASVRALDPLPSYIVVTGDLVNYGTVDQYLRFAELMRTARLPYFVIPGNHDDRDRLRETLPPESFGGSRDERVRYAIEGFPIRLVGLDLNSPRPWPGAVADRASLAWLDETLHAAPEKATIVAVHQPPFRTGLHYLDLGGFVGKRRLRSIVDRHAGVRAVISGHIHCTRSTRWKCALASSAPSTAPQIIPLLFMQGRVVGVSHERPGFVIHDLLDDHSLERTVYRLDDAGTYAPVSPNGNTDYGTT
jgi:3',5'-cyclic AMP phosphodiesterase CpdA